MAMDIDLATVEKLSTETLEGAIVIFAKFRLMGMDMEPRKRLAIMKYIRTVVSNMKRQELVFLALGLHQLNGYDPELEQLIRSASEGYDEFMKRRNEGK